MEDAFSLDDLVSYRLTGWRRQILFVLCVGLIFLLGGLRRETDAELAFASLALLPVLIVAWFGGKWQGLSVAFLAAAMWIVADLSADRTFSALWIPWVNAAVRMILYSTVSLLAAQVRTLFEREHRHATRDALTGLHNRRFFTASGNSEVERARRYKKSVAILFMDLDNFKLLNDTMGHHAGDAALQATGRALLATTRETDVVSRLGGDEFAVLLPEIDHDAAVATAHKILDAVNAALADYPPVRSSIGVAWFEVAQLSFESMLKEADGLMYAVKSAGKNDLLAKRFTPVQQSVTKAQRG